MLLRRAHRDAKGKQGGWAVRYARNKLEKLDLIEQRDTVWRVVDPVFGLWLSNY